MKQLLASLLLALTLHACKKGTEDPALSLLSRRSRLSNDWQIKTLATQNQVTTVTTSPTQQEVTTTSSFNQSFIDENYIYSFTAPNTTNKTTPDTLITGKVSIHRMSLYKDGTWNREQEYTITYDSTANGITYLVKQNINTQEQGVWAFLRGTKPDRKDKEEIELATRQLVKKTTYSIFTGANIVPITTTNQTVNVTLQDNEQSEIWRLIGLKGNKVVAVIENKPQTNTKTVTQNSGGQPSTSTAVTTVKQVTNILLQD